MIDLSDIRILYIEDDESLCNLFKVVIEAHGYSVDVTHYGEDGLALHATQPYDLLVIDYQLPGKSGIDIARRLLNDDPNIPIVMVTGKGSEQIAAEALVLGVYNYVIKDSEKVYLELLPNTISSALKRSAEHHAKINAEKVISDAIEGMSEGFLYFDADDRLALVNTRIADIYPLVADVFVPGVSYEKCMRAGVERGQWGPDNDQDEENWIQARLAYHFDPVGTFEFYTPDGRTIRVEEKKTAGGGIVGVRTDITKLKDVEQQLRDSQKRFQDFAEIASDWLWELDADLRYTFVSNAYLRITGRNPVEIIGKTRREMYQGYIANEKKAWHEFLDVLDRHEDFEGFTYTYIRKDGQPRILKTSGHAIFDDNGKFAGYRGTGRDFTERVKKERTAQLLREAIETFTDSVVLFDQDERVVFTSDRYHEIYPDSPSKNEIVGVSLEQLLRRSLTSGQIGHPLAKTDPEAWVAERLSERRALDEGTGETNHTNGRIYNYRYRRTTEGGQILVQTDITERREAEQRIEKSEARLRNILESSPFGVAILSNKTSERLYTNPQLIEMFGGKSTDSLMHRKIADSWMDPNDLLELQRVALKSGWHFDLESHRKRIDGTPWWCLMSSRPIDFEDEPAHMVWHFDISERKRTDKKIEAQRDELEKLNNQKDKFFSIIAHDLKGPFTALLGYTSLLSADIGHSDKESIIEAASVVHKSAQQVFKLLENLLEWSHLQMRQLGFEPAPVDLTEIIDTNLELFAPSAKEKAIRLSGKRRKPLVVFADVHMVDTVVRNLINNAIKFTSEKGIVTVSARQNGKWAEVKVSDTGVGILADKAARLFLLGENTSTKGTHGETGTGLGLQLCKELVETQGGQIHVESTERVGTTFRITLPLYRKAPNQVRQDGS